jgi:glycerol uptake facilitator protein
VLGVSHSICVICDICGKFCSAFCINKEITIMNAYLAEFVGTALLVLLGDGVVANVVLARTKGAGGGGGGAWIVITAGWAMAVFIAVLCVADISGAHINPAVSVGLAAAGRFEWVLVPGYVIAQLAGGIAGGMLVFAFYRPHFSDTPDPNAKLGTFCCAPQYRNLGWAMLCEVVGTFVLVFAVMAIQPARILAGEGATVAPMEFQLGSISALPVALVVLGIGLSLGGTTGYAINPARDLGPRIAHFLLPIPGKRDSDWGYAWVPVIGPILGGLIAAIVYPLIAAKV